MSFSILRLERIKNHNDVTGIQKHVQRETENYTNQDINKNKMHLNYDLLNQGQIHFNEHVKKRLEDGYHGIRKIRSDAIKLVDGLITSDDVFFENMNDQQVKMFFEDALEFIKSEYGEENIMYATVHLDEKTPHLHFGFVPLTKDGRLSAKEVLGNKKKMSLLQDKFNDFVNEKGYELNRGESSIDTERKHVEMNTYKEQTAYHKQELDQVVEDFNMALVKWNKMHELNKSEQHDAFKTIVASKQGPPMPEVEIKERLFGRTEIDREQVKSLQEWGEGAVDLIKQQQSSMKDKDSEIERLHELVVVQDQEVTKRVNRKFKSEIDKYKRSNQKLAAENELLKQRNSEIINDVYELQDDKEHLDAEISVLKQFRYKTMQFLEKFNLRGQFERFVGKLKGRDDDSFER